MFHNTIAYLSDPTLRGLYLPGVVAGVAIALLCSVLSVLVVLRRLAFIGQGISHAAFGGVGIAAVLGLAGAAATGAEAAAQFAVIVAFCLAAALAVGGLSARGKAEADTIIGIILVGSMALGAVLLHVASRLGRSGTVAWESMLFGSILNVAWPDALVAWTVTLASLFLLWWCRRGLLFWAFDEPAAGAFGVRATPLKALVMILLALATVTAMKLAGVVLATAMLVLPGAAALTLSARLARVLALAAVFALLGVVAGVVISFEFDWPTGPSIVGVLCALFAAARAAAALRR